MQAIKNTGFLIACNTCGTGAFAPSVAYAYDSEAQTMTITDNSVFAAGDGLKRLQINITDGNGDSLSAHEDVTATPIIVDVSTLDPFLGLTVTVTVVTNDRMLGDLAAYQIGATAPIAGNLRFTNKSQESNN